MGSFAGLLTGIGDAMHQGHLEDTQNALAQKQSIMDLYGKLLQTPEFEEAHPEILQSYLGLAGTPTDKLPKAIKQYSDLNTVLGPALARAQSRQQSQPVAPPPVMGSPQNAPASPVAGAPVGMESLNPAITTMPGQPAAPPMPQVGPPPAQVAAQADAVGAQQGALPGVSTIVPPGAAAAPGPVSTLPPEPVRPLSPRWIDPAAWRKYDEDSKAYDDLKKAVLTHQIERGQMTGDRKALMSAVGIDPTAEGLAKATPQQLRMLEFMAGGNPGTSRKDLITVAPGQQLFDPNTNKVVATGTAKPLTEAEQKDQQIFADYANTIGVDPESLTAADKVIARRIDKISDPLVQSAINIALTTKGKPLTAQELNATIAKAEKSKADMLRPPGASDIGTWSIAEDSKGNPILLNSKTGATKPADGIQKSGTADKKAAADDKQNGPARRGISYADDYLKNGGGPIGPDGKPLNGKVEYTGSGDEALLEKFFDLAKPTSGFRMSQPQIDMLKNAQGWKDSIAAKARHVTTGTWFSDPQRQQIVSTMKQIAKANGVNLNAPSVSAPPSSDASSTPKVQKWGRDAKGNPIPLSQ